jgi:hypothetical protein
MLVALMVSAALASSSGVTGANALPLADPRVEEPDAMQRFFPFSVSDTAEQPVKDNFLVSQVLGFLLSSIGGGLWGPVVLVPGAEFSTDVLVSWLVPWAATNTLVLVGFTLTAIATFVFAPAFLCFCAVCPVGLGGLYVSTNASLMAVDRGLKSKRGESRPKRSSEAKPEGSERGTAPPASYAY